MADIQELSLGLEGGDVRLLWNWKFRPGMILEIHEIQNSLFYKQGDWSSESSKHLHFQIKFYFQIKCKWAGHPKFINLEMSRLQTSRVLSHRLPCSSAISLNVSTRMWSLGCDIEEYIFQSGELQQIHITVVSSLFIPGSRADQSGQATLSVVYLPLPFFSKYSRTPGCLESLESAFAHQQALPGAYPPVDSDQIDSCPSDRSSLIGAVPDGSAFTSWETLIFSPQLALAFFIQNTIILLLLLKTVLMVHTSFHLILSVMSNEIWIIICFFTEVKNEDVNLPSLYSK